MQPQLLCVLTGCGSFLCAFQWLYIDTFIGYEIILVGITTCAQHLTEKIDKFHSIQSNIFGLNSNEWVWIDRIFAINLALSLRNYIFRLQLYLVDYIIISSALSLLYICDSSQLDKWPLLYIITHSIWHFLIFLFIWRLGTKITYKM